MSDWKPDNEFLDFLVEKFEEDSGSVSANIAVVGMREGKEELWRDMYALSSKRYQKEFETYKANKQ